MRRSKDPQRRKLNQEQRRFLQVMMIPLVVVILIIVILVAEHFQAGPEETQEAEETTAATLEQGMTVEPALDSGDWERLPEEPGDEPEEPETAEENETETEAGETDPFEAEDFCRDGVPEVLALMNSYFQARESGDAGLMNQIYGIGEVSGQALEEQSARMRSNSKYVQGFENIATYVIDGADDHSWLVYTVADINFYFSKTRAPMIFSCYVTMDPEGNCTIVDQRNYTQEILRLTDEANHSPEVKRLAADVNRRMREALNSDENLKNVYGVLQEGSPLWEGTKETEPEVVIGGQP